MKVMAVHRNIRASLLSSAVFLLSATSAFAQQQAPTDKVEEIIVTGSRIAQPNLVSVSPVTVISAADFKNQGVTRVEDMINSLPQAFAAQGAALSNGSTGTATVNLRGLGATRTLVLVDGRRLMPGTPNTSGPALAADLNFIPSALVKRVDILTGGASAVYGADAVAGVVNFIMMKDFEGVRFDGQYGTYQHNNGNPVGNVIRTAAAASPTPQLYGLPAGSVWNGGQAEATMVFGANASNGKGNITAYAGYRNVNPILEGDRDYSSCTLNSGASFTAAGCGGSGTAFPARVGSYVVDVTNPAGNTFRPRDGTRDLYNFGPLNYYQRPDKRYMMGAFAHYEITPWAEAYTDAMFMDDVSKYQIAPGGIFAGTFSINCANPFLSAQQKGLMAATTASGGGTCATNPAGTFTNTVARRNIEGGGRQGETHHQQYRFVMGVKGDITESWNYDATLQYGHVSFNQGKTGFFRTSAIQNSLNVVNNAAGQPTCVSVINGTDPACVPYNIFQLGKVTPAALTYLQTPSYDGGHLTEKIATFTVGGKLGDYGLKSPAAENGVAVSLGAEYRSEALDYAADYVAAAGLLNGAGGSSPPVNGSYNVSELFAETRIPLIENKELARSVAIEAAVRHSNYTSSGVTDTFKIAGDYTPVDMLRLRASYQRAVRAPHIIELFSPQNVVLDGSQDPCAGLKAGDPKVAACASAFNLTTAQVLAIEANPANQYNGLTGGNPTLAPEKSKTYSLGFVVQPVEGLNVSLDWFNIQVGNYINKIGADLIINRCLDTKNAYFCNLVHRDAAGSLWLSPNGYITDTTLNTGAQKTSGIDLNADYKLRLETIGLPNAGDFGINFTGTALSNLSTQPLPGDPYYDCAGLYGTICLVPNPKWRHKTRFTWSPPYAWEGILSDLSFSIQWRYFSSVMLDAYSSDKQLVNTGLQLATDKSKPAQSYFDLAFNMTVMDRVKMHAGINNLFDKDPPLNGQSNCPTGPCNGNTWPQVYDSFGRYLFVGMTIDY